MPATSISSLTSWGLYLLASTALLVIAAPMVAGSAQAARIGADSRNLDGVKTVLDNLSPGMTATFVFVGSPGSDPIRIEGHSISCTSASGKMTVLSKWELPNMDLQQSVVYSVQLEGNSVRVVGPV
jgi:hypothetical protein